MVIFIYIKILFYYFQLLNKLPLHIVASSDEGGLYRGKIIAGGFPFDVNCKRSQRYPLQTADEAGDDADLNNRRRTARCVFGLKHLNLCFQYPVTDQSRF